MTRAYTYGLLPPTRGAGLVAEQMRLGHAYRNTLVEIERARRRAVREILERGADPDAVARLASLVAERDEARQGILRARAAARRRAETSEARARVRALNERIAGLRAEVRQRARGPSESARVGLAWAQLASYEAVRVARAASGVYWGTYLLHEQAMRSAATAPTPPEFVPWTGQGRVSVQLQGGLRIGDLESDTRLQIAPGRRMTQSVGTASHGIPLNGNGERVGRGALRSRVLRLRVGSDGRAPIWAEWPMQMHRELPAGGRIKVATVSLRRRGTRWDWSVQIVVDDEEGEGRAGRPSPTEGAVALNLGYARRDDGQIRAGYAYGSDGWHREILAPARLSEALDKADSIRAIRDRLMDEARAALGQWIGPQDPASIPAWFVERTRHMAAWRSAGRFASLARDWRPGWWDAGSDGYDLLERWRARDLHLERYETGLRSSTLRARRDAYRVLARELASRYRTLIIDDTDLRNFQELPDVESEEDPAHPAARRQRVVVAPHELRGACTDAFGRERTVRRSAVDVTREHAGCGHVNPRADSRELTCGGCGVLYDQDANACQNLLRRQSEEGSPRETKRRTFRIRKRAVT